MSSLAILVDGDDQPTQPCGDGADEVTIMPMFCDHCDAEYYDIGAPLACGHNICGCNCIEECPYETEEHFVRVMFDRTLEELLWVVPKYDE